MESENPEDVDFFMLKDKIIATDQIIQMASEKDKQIKSITSNYKKTLQRFTEKQNEFDLLYKNSKQFSEYCNKYHSSLEREFNEKKEAYNLLEKNYNDYVNSSEIKFQTACSEIEQEKIKYEVLLKKFEKLEKNAKSPTKTTNAKIKRFEKEIEEKNERLAELEEKILKLDLQHNNDLKRISELQLECTQLKNKIDTIKNKKISKSKQHLHKKITELEAELNKKNSEIDIIKLSQDSTVEELTKKFEREKNLITQEIKNDDSVQLRKISNEKRTLENQIIKLKELINVRKMSFNVETQTDLDSDTEISNFNEVLTELSYLPRLLTPLPVIETVSTGVQTETITENKKILNRQRFKNNVRNIIIKRFKNRIRNKNIKTKAKKSSPIPVQQKCDYPEMNNPWNFVPPYCYMPPMMPPNVYLPYYPNVYYPQNPPYNFYPPEQKECSRCSSRSSVQRCISCQGFHLPLSPNSKRLKRSRSADNLRSDFDSASGSNDSRFSKSKSITSRNNPKKRLRDTKLSRRFGSYDSDETEASSVENVKKIRKLNDVRNNRIIDTSEDEWMIPDEWKSKNYNFSKKCNDFVEKSNFSNEGKKPSINNSECENTNQNSNSRVQNDNQKIDKPKINSRAGSRNKNISDDFIDQNRRFSDTNSDVTYNLRSRNNGCKKNIFDQEKSCNKRARKRSSASVSSKISQVSLLSKSTNRSRSSCLISTDDEANEVVSITNEDNNIELSEIENSYSLRPMSEEKNSVDEHFCDLLEKSEPSLNENKINKKPLPKNQEEHSTEKSSRNEEKFSRKSSANDEISRIEGSVLSVNEDKITRNTNVLTENQEEISRNVSINENREDNTKKAKDLSENHEQDSSTTKSSSENQEKISRKSSACTLSSGNEGENSRTEKSDSLLSVDKDKIIENTNDLSENQEETSRNVSFSENQEKNSRESPACSLSSAKDSENSRTEKSGSLLPVGEDKITENTNVLPENQELTSRNVSISENQEENTRKSKDLSENQEKPSSSTKSSSENQEEISRNVSISENRKENTKKAKVLSENQEKTSSSTKCSCENQERISRNVSISENLEEITREAKDLSENQEQMSSNTKSSSRNQEQFGNLSENHIKISGKSENLNVSGNLKTLLDNQEENSRNTRSLSENLEAISVINKSSSLPIKEIISKNEESLLENRVEISEIEKSDSLPTNRNKTSRKLNNLSDNQEEISSLENSSSLSSTNHKENSRLENPFTLSFRNQEQKSSSFTNKEENSTIDRSNSLSSINEEKSSKPTKSGSLLSTNDEETSRNDNSCRENISKNSKSCSLLSTNEEGTSRNENSCLLSMNQGENFISEKSGSVLPKNQEPHSINEEISKNAKSSSMNEEEIFRNEDSCPSMNQEETFVTKKSSLAKNQEQISKNEEEIHKYPKSSSMNEHEISVIPKSYSSSSENSKENQIIVKSCSLYPSNEVIDSGMQKISEKLVENSIAKKSDEEILENQKIMSTMQHDDSSDSDNHSINLRQTSKNMKNSTKKSFGASRYNLRHNSVSNEIISKNNDKSGKNEDKMEFTQSNSCDIIGNSPSRYNLRYNNSNSLKKNSEKLQSRCIESSKNPAALVQGQTTDDESDSSVILENVRNSSNYNLRFDSSLNKSEDLERTNLKDLVTNPQILSPIRSYKNRDGRMDDTSFEDDTNDMDIKQENSRKCIQNLSKTLSFALQPRYNTRNSASYSRIHHSTPKKNFQRNDDASINVIINEAINTNLITDSVNNDLKSTNLISNNDVKNIDKNLVINEDDVNKMDVDNENVLNDSFNVSVDEFENYCGSNIFRVIDSSDEEMPYCNVGFSKEEIEDKDVERQRLLMAKLYKSLAMTVETIDEDTKKSIKNPEDQSVQNSGNIPKLQSMKRANKNLLCDSISRRKDLPRKNNLKRKLANQFRLRNKKIQIDHENHSKKRSIKKSTKIQEDLFGSDTELDADSSIGSAAKIDSNSNKTKPSKETPKLSENETKSSEELKKLLKNETGLKNVNIATNFVQPFVDCDVVTHYKTKKRIAHTAKSVQNQPKIQKITNFKPSEKKIPIDKILHSSDDSKINSVHENSTLNSTETTLENSDVDTKDFKNPTVSSNKIFKRPEKSKFKIIPSTPKSPDVIEYVYEEPKIIPLEPAKSFKLKRIRKYVEKISSDDVTLKVMDDSVKFLAEQNPLKVASIIVDEAIKDVTLELDKTFTPPAPQLNRVHQRLILFLDKLSNISNHEKIHECILKIARQKLLNEKRIEYVHCLTRFYVGVSMQKFDAEQIRILCVDSAYYMNDYFVPFLFIVLTMYPEVLPTAEHLKTNPLLLQCMPKALIQAVKMKTLAKPGFNLKNLNFLLTQHYGYEMTRANNDTLMEEFVKIYLETHSKIVFTAIIVLCKNVPNAWTFSQIKKYFMPIVNKNLHIKDSWEFVALTIHLITRIMQPLCYKMEDKDKVQEIRDWFSGFVEVESTLPLIIRTNVSEALTWIVSKSVNKPKLVVKKKEPVKKKFVRKKKKKSQKKNVVKM